MGDFVVYIKFERNNEVSDKKISIGDIADVYCADENIESRVRAIRLISINADKRARFVFSIVDVCKKIYEVCEKIEVQNIGETDFIIDYISPQKPWYEAEWTKYVKLTLLCLVTLCGSAFTIVTYDNDVDIPGVFARFYNFFQGGDSGSRVMEIMYAIGFGLGIIIFFNHFGGKKLTSDPTPIEVEMCSYEKEIDSAIIDRNAGDDKNE